MSETDLGRSLRARASHFFQCNINHTQFPFSLGSKPHAPGLQSEVVRPFGDGGWSPGKEPSERDADWLAPDVHRHVSPADDLQRGQSRGRHVQAAPAPEDRVTDTHPGHGDLFACSVAAETLSRPQVRSSSGCGSLESPPVGCTRSSLERHGVIPVAEKNQILAVIVSFHVLQFSENI